MMMFGGAECMTADDLLPKNDDKAAKSANESSNNAFEDVTLYHGSRGGIKGEISPSAGRADCDFGQGFYMGQSPEQAKGLVVESEKPIFYELKFKLSEISRDKILVLEGKDWVYAVLASRGRCDEFNSLKLVQNWIKKLNEYDVIIGKIADDRMKTAMRRFEDGSLTDNGLIACLQYADYGNQYVAKTNIACSKIEIVSSKILDTEIEEIQKYSERKRQESTNIVNEMVRKYRNNGLYLDNIIDKEKHLEAKKGYVE